MGPRVNAAECKRVAIIVATVTLMAGLMLCDRLRGEEVSYVGPAVLYVGLAGADLASTYHAERFGAIEANPAMRSARVPKKVAQAALLTLVDARLQKRSRGLAWGFRVAAVIGHGLIVRRNLRVAEQARGAR